MPSLPNTGSLERELAKLARARKTTKIYLFEQSICWFLLVEGNEAKVLGFAIFAAINWPLDFHNLTVLAKMLPNDIFRDGCVFELADVNLALFRRSLKLGNADQHRVFNV